VAHSLSAEPSEHARLAARALTGDATAFEEIVLGHDQTLLRACFVITGDSVLARDAVQNCWQIAWAKRGRIRHPERFRAWLLAVACNEARMLMRKRARANQREQTLEGAADVEEPLHAVDPDLARALRALTPVDQELIAYRYGAGLDIREIANHLHKSPAAVRTRLFRALARLRKELQ
jgi:RNA polymerase sigma-70 factor, ECF subfamily